jgi:hypothetical protein
LELRRVAVDVVRPAGDVAAAQLAPADEYALRPGAVLGATYLSMSVDRFGSVVPVEPDGRVNP